jgi:hypothetical protein
MMSFFFWLPLNLILHFEILQKFGERLFLLGGQALGLRADAIDCSDTSPSSALGLHDLLLASLDPITRERSTFGRICIGNDGIWHVIWFRQSLFVILLHSLQNTE